MTTQVKTIKIPGVQIWHLFAVSMAGLVLSFVFFSLGSLLSGSGETGISEPIYNENAASDFQKLQVAARIMPSQNTEGNLVLMNRKSEDSEISEFY